MQNLTAKDRHGLATAIIHSAGGPNVDAIPVDQPVNTVLARDHMALTEAFVTTAGGPEGQGRNATSVEEPLPTVLCDDRHVLVEAEVTPEAFISPQRSNSAPHSTNEPIPTLTGSEHMMLVQPAFLFANNTNNVPQSVDGPVPTVTGANRLALVQPVINGLALEIYFRMLQPHELSRAMGFPDTYEFAGTREDVVKQIGNAWSGELAEALCDAALQPYLTPKARRKVIVKAA